MFVRTCFATFVLLSVVACESDFESNDENLGQSQAALTHEVVRKTSHGETIRVSVPDPAPTVEVPAGAKCGVQNSAGAFLSCQAGTYCLSPSEGAAGTCQAVQRRQRLDEER
jgi:hypothetical protein